MISTSLLFFDSLLRQCEVDCNLEPDDVHSEELSFVFLAGLFRFSDSTSESESSVDKPFSLEVESIFLFTVDASVWVIGLSESLKPSKSDSKISS